jgi:hypothetical protein
MDAQKEYLIVQTYLTAMYLIALSPHLDVMLTISIATLNTILPMGDII